MTMQEAVGAPRIINRNDLTALEKQTFLVDKVVEFEKRGHKTSIMDLNSGLHGIFIDANGMMFSGSDPRREGLALGL